MKTPKQLDWIINPDYKDDDPESIFRQPITKLASGVAQTVSFDEKTPFKKVQFNIRDLIWNNVLNGWEYKPSDQAAKPVRSSGPLWVGSFNWYGEMHEIETHAVSKDAAFINMCSQLASKVKQSVGSVIGYFKIRSNAFSIKESGHAI